LVAADDQLQVRPPRVSQGDEGFRSNAEGFGVAGTRQLRGDVPLVNARQRGRLRHDGTVGFDLDRNVRREPREKLSERTLLQ